MKHRTLLSVTFLCAICAAEPVLLRSPSDLWSSFASPWFYQSLEQSSWSANTVFPGLERDSAGNMVILGKRTGSGSDARFCDLYAADQLSTERVAGLAISGLEYASDVENGTLSNDGMRITRMESGRSAWTVDAWYVPKNTRVLTGFSILAADRRSARYSIHDDSIVDVAWERRVAETDSSNGILGATVLLAGPKKGHIRIGAQLSGNYLRSTRWYQPPLSDSIDEYDGARANSLRLNISGGYVRADPARGKRLFINVGIQTGGHRSYALNSPNDSWEKIDTTMAQRDSLGGFVEGFYARTFGEERWNVSLATAGFWQSVYHYDAAAGAVSGIEALRNDQRSDRCWLGMPLLLQVKPSGTLTLFYSWKPGLTYSRERRTEERGSTAVDEHLGLSYTEMSLGCSWTPSTRFSLTVVPSIRESILLSAIEARVQW